MMPGDADAVKGATLGSRHRSPRVGVRPARTAARSSCSSPRSSSPRCSPSSRRSWSARSSTRRSPTATARSSSGSPRSPSAPRSATPALQIVQRWCSARVGEGLIADLRRALFAKVQRMPIAFFTRTPTGAITSRLNNDVIGAQTAVTSTLGSVVSNVVVLVTTLVAMLALEWRLTLLALVVLPMFVIPARRVGRRLQGISREQMQHNAAMNTQMTERFNVSGAMLVKLFGRPRPRERDVRPTRQRASATPASARRMLGRVFFVALGLVAALGTAAIYGVGAHLVVDGDITTGTLVALAALVDARLPAAHRADERPRRPDDVDGELRAGVRGARRARGDPGAAGRGRPRRCRAGGSSSTTSCSATRRPSESSIASMEQHDDPRRRPRPSTCSTACR